MAVKTWCRRDWIDEMTTNGGRKPPKGSECECPAGGVLDQIECKRITTFSLLDVIKMAPPEDR